MYKRFARPSLWHGALSPHLTANFMVWPWASMIFDDSNWEFWKPSSAKIAIWKQESQWENMRRHRKVGLFWSCDIRTQRIQMIANAFKRKVGKEHERTIVPRRLLSRVSESARLNLLVMIKARLGQQMKHHPERLVQKSAESLSMLIFQDVSVTPVLKRIRKEPDCQDYSEASDSPFDRVESNNGQMWTMDVRMVSDSTNPMSNPFECVALRRTSRLHRGWSSSAETKILVALEALRIAQQKCRAKTKRPLTTQYSPCPQQRATDCSNQLSLRCSCWVHGGPCGSTMSTVKAFPPCAPVLVARKNGAGANTDLLKTTPRSKFFTISSTIYTVILLYQYKWHFMMNNIYNKYDLLY